MTSLRSRLTRIDRRDWNHEKPDHPEKSQPNEHPDERTERMQADLLANNARLDDVAHHENEHIEEQQPKRQRRIAKDGDDDRPRNEDAAGAKIGRMSKIATQKPIKIAFGICSSENRPTAR